MSGDKYRIKILNYSRQKFFRQGFYKTSMDEISSELRISKKTIYKFFDTKEDLVSQIINDSLENDEIILDEIINSGDNVIIKFIRIMSYLQMRFSELSEYWLRDLQIHIPKKWEALDEFRVIKVNSVMKKLTEQGKREKSIKNLDSSLIIEITISSMRMILRNDFLTKNKLTVVDAYLQIFDLLLNGILTEKGKRMYNSEKRKIKSNFEKNLLLEREFYV
ncbi:MAG: TetR/AcrR family transcriptional regulator [Ignavibacteria bacterium]